MYLYMSHNRIVSLDRLCSMAAMQKPSYPFSEFSHVFL